MITTLRSWAQGINNSAACRAVGINRKTGTRWRYGRTVTNRVGQPLVYPPILTPSSRGPGLNPASHRDHYAVVRPF